eukprot:TRINITY_DN49612_c0_g1_i2.p2 TRINITY_DN49612_c0_g1~~TRINITY_DN49612_c0_g1_i2.p2  ORF type:complete len:198 (-),score=23.83 TRINITY_DN49612_c0_g1_i2:145-738(-)
MGILKMTEKDKAVEVHDKKTYPCNMFCLPKWCLEYMDSVLLPGGLVYERIAMLAQEIFKRYQHSPRVTLVTVIAGADRFMNELMAAMQPLLSAGESQIQFAFQYLRLERDRAEVKILDLKSELITGEDILVIEDVYNSGDTMNCIIPYLQSLKPRSLGCAVLLQKRNPMQKRFSFSPDFVGFSIPMCNVVGLSLIHI